MSTLWVAFIVGLIIGGSAGFFCAALLACSREEKFWRETLAKKFGEGE